jgi:hypothetical protein
MPAKSYKVGDKIRVSMHGGKIVDAVIAEVGTIRNFSGNPTLIGSHAGLKLFIIVGISRLDDTVGSG